MAASADWKAVKANARRTAQPSAFLVDVMSFLSMEKNQHQAMLEMLPTAAEYIGAGPVQDDVFCLAISWSCGVVIS
jgi:hypothetical protein